MVQCEKLCQDYLWLYYIYCLGLTPWFYNLIAYVRTLFFVRTYAIGFGFDLDFVIIFS